jgi:hypothetical protein
VVDLGQGKTKVKMQVQSDDKNGETINWCSEDWEIKFMMQVTKESLAKNGGRYIHKITEDYSL